MAVLVSAVDFLMRIAGTDQGNGITAFGVEEVVAAAMALVVLTSVLLLVVQHILGMAPPILDVGGEGGSDLTD